MIDQGKSLSEQSSFNHPQVVTSDLVGGQAIELVAQLQDELDVVRRQLAQCNRLGQLGMLTAALAHETNNLLTPIGSYAQLALKDPSNKAMTERALQAALVGTQKAGKLAESVLELAGPSESSEGQSLACLADEVVAEAIACMSPTLKQTGVELHAAVEPISVAIDALALEQVLINLISNACQAMAEMRGMRRIRVESSELNGRLIVRVIDNGPGVPESIRQAIFEPFVTTASSRADSAASSDQGKQPAGSGLGLSICQQIVEAAGGQIALASSSAGGCIFEIDLPLAR